MKKHILCVLVIVLFSSQLIIAESNQLNLESDSCTIQFPGDLNNDSLINSDDLTFLNKFIRGYGPSPFLIANADVNGDCILSLADITYLDNYLNNSGTPPVDCTCNSPDTCQFQNPGDFANNGGPNDISDLVLFVEMLWGGYFPILANADANGDCRVSDDDITTIEYMIYGLPGIDCTCMSPKICFGKMPGDLNSDEQIDNNDLAMLKGYLSGYGQPPIILEHADIDADCVIDFTDVAYLEDYLNNGGDAPSDCVCSYAADTCSFQFPGDVNNDGIINFNDVTFLTNFLIDNSVVLPVLANGDLNGDCSINNDDLQYLTDYLSAGGPSPVDCTCFSPSTSCANQKPGDFNSDGYFDLSDITFISSYLHNRYINKPSPLANADANGDCIFNVGDSKHMIDFLFNGGPHPVLCTCANPAYKSICCWEQRGNVDYDPADIIDISDLVVLVDFMFNGFNPTYICTEEANINGDSGETLDISDLVNLVDYLFNNGPLPPVCP